MESKHPDTDPSGAGIHSVGEAPSNTQTEARSVVGEVDHPTVGSVPTIEHPLNYRNATAGIREVPPLLGEDTEAVLRELGYDGHRIGAVIEAEAIHGRTDDLPGGDRYLPWEVGGAGATVTRRSVGRPSTSSPANRPRSIA